MQTTFESKTGKTIAVEHITERGADADQSVRVRCNRLSVTIDGRSIGDTYLTEIEGHGLCIRACHAGRNGHITIPIPADKIDDVQAIYDAYHAEVRREIDAEDKAAEIDRSINAHTRRIEGAE